jgi:hypothetical protein
MDEFFNKSKNITIIFLYQSFNFKLVSEEDALKKFLNLIVFSYNQNERSILFSQLINNGIDSIEILKQCKDEELKEIGINIGNRKKIKNALIKKRKIEIPQNVMVNYI